MRIECAIGVVFHPEKDEVLISRRKQNDTYPGLWEFPGGKIEPGETHISCVRRELSEEVGLKVTVGKFLMKILREADGVTLDLNFYECSTGQTDPVAIECDEVRWVDINNLDKYEFPPANEELLSFIVQNHICS